jgi:hypothetical protein
MVVKLNIFMAMILYVTISNVLLPWLKYCVLHSLGINLMFDTAEISWDNAKIHMQHPEMLRDNWVDALEQLEQEILYAHDPDTMDAEKNPRYY